MCRNNVFIAQYYWLEFNQPYPSEWRKSNFENQFPRLILRQNFSTVQPNSQIKGVKGESSPFQNRKSIPEKSHKKWLNPESSPLVHWTTPDQN